MGLGTEGGAGGGAAEGAAAGKKGNVVYRYRFSEPGPPRGKLCAEDTSGSAWEGGTVDPAKSPSSGGAGARGWGTPRRGGAKKEKQHMPTKVGLGVERGNAKGWR